MPPAAVMPNCATAVGSEATVRQVFVAGLNSSTVAAGARGLWQVHKRARLGGRAPAAPADGVEQAIIVDQTTAAEHAARVQLEIVNLIAHGAPVEDTLVGEVPLVERAVERDRLARA